MRITAIGRVEPRPFTWHKARAATPPRDPRDPARAGDLARGAAREVRQGRRDAPPREVRARVARALAAAEPEGAARPLGGALPRGAGARLHSRRAASTPPPAPRSPPRSSIASCSPWATPSPRWSTASPASTPRSPRPPRPCAAAAAWATTSPPSAPRARCVRGHQLARERAGVVHARLRPVVRDGGIGRRAARRADGRAALRPSRHRALHPREGCGRAHQLQHLGGRDRRVHAGGRGRRATFELVHKAEPVEDVEGRGRVPRGDGMWVYRKVRARELWDQVMRSTYDHAEPGVVFLDRMNRDNNLHYCETIESTQPVQRAALPAYGCCCLGSIDLTRFVRDAVRRRSARSTSTRSGDVVDDRRPHARQRARRDALAARSSSAPRRWPSGAWAWASPAWATRSRCCACATTRDEARAMAAKISEFMRDRAYVASIELAKERGAFPMFNARPLPLGRQLRLAPAARDQGCDPQARHPQLAPAVDRPHRHHQPRLRRQRLQRHRAAVLVDLHAQEAHGRRHAQGVPRRGPRVAPLSPPARRGREAARLLRDGARDLRRRAPGDGRGGRAVHRHQHLEDGERARGLSVRGVRGPLHEGVEVGAEGPRDVSAQRGAGRGAHARPRAETPRRARRRRRQPPPRDQDAAASRCSPACAGPAAPRCPRATSRGPT